MQRIKQILEENPDSAGWEEVPFPSPLSSTIDYIYSVDRDAGTLTVTKWEDYKDTLRYVILRLDLPTVEAFPVGLPVVGFLPPPSNHVNQNTISSDETTSESIISGTLSFDFDIPTSLNELQHRLFTDFVFAWRFYVDAPSIWQYPSPLFNTLAIAILRLASWDFEILLDGNNVELPITHQSIPSWTRPETDIFWFHGFLVILCGTLGDEASVTAAILRGKSFVTEHASVCRTKTRLILISLRHVAFVEPSGRHILCSTVLPLIVNSSAIHCSPGFRVLTYALSTYCWKKPLDQKEQWGVSLPPEIFNRILQFVEAKDILSFSRASFAVEKWYYSSVPQLPNVRVQTFDFTLPCCGKRINSGNGGISCTSCYAWQHLKCAGLESQQPSAQYICSKCRDQESPPSTMLTPSGIYQSSRRKTRSPGCLVSVCGKNKVLQQRLGKPAHLRPEIRFMGNASFIPPSLINYAVLFDGAFSGLAYGLEDPPC